MRLQNEGEGNGAATLRAMNIVFQELKERHHAEGTMCSDPLPVLKSVADAAAKAKGAIGFALSQLDDWLHRGTKFPSLPT